MKNFVVRLVALVLTIAGLAWLWLSYPNLIVRVFDMNLALIKFAASLVPAPYGAMGEVALRGLGGGNEAMLRGNAGTRTQHWV